MDVRRVNLSTDLAPLQEFFFEVFGQEAATEVWNWKYNPPWSTDVYAWIGFALGKVVLHAGAVHLRGLVAGAEIPFFQFGDVAVHPDHRGQFNLSFAPDNIINTIKADYPQHVYYGFTGRRTALLYRRKGGRVIEEACDRIKRIKGDEALDIDLELRALDWDAEAIDDLWEK